MMTLTSLKIMASMPVSTVSNFRLSQKCNLDNGALTRGDDDDSSDSDDEERVGDVITGTESRHHKAAKIA
jgi:hypothetical protein